MIIRAVIKKWQSVNIRATKLYEEYSLTIKVLLIVPGDAKSIHMEMSGRWAVYVCVCPLSAFCQGEYEQECVANTVPAVCSCCPEHWLALSLFLLPSLSLSLSLSLSDTL